MLSLIFTVIAGSFTLYRPAAADKIDPRCFETKTERVMVWVYFTDKGVFDPGAYDQVLKMNERFVPGASRARRERRGGVYDFNDLPVMKDYVEEIKSAGGVMRWESKWLNAASFSVDKRDLGSIADLGFVYRIAPVSSYHRADALEIFGGQQLSDTSALTYKQHSMFNIHRLHDKAITGSGVKVGLLDSGFSDDHEVFQFIKLAGQYDFISGDRIMFDTLPFGQRSAMTMRKTLISDLFVHDGGRRDIVLYAGDSLYSPRDWSREIYALTSTDGGRNWTGPTDLSRRYARLTSGHPWACGQDTVFAFWHETDGFNHTIRCKARVDTGWQEISPAIGQGLFPSADAAGDSFYLSYVQSESLLAFRKGTISGYSGEQVLYQPGERIKLPWLVLRSRNPGDSLVGILCYTRPTLDLVFLRSTDRGQTWSRATVASQATDFALASQDDNLYLVYKDYSRMPKPSLGFSKSTDFGLSWQVGAKLADTLLSLGKVGLAGHGNNLFAEWERGGMVYYRRSDDQGTSWGRAESLRTDFYYLPTPKYLSGPFDTTLFNFWVWRGDNNTDYETSDKNKYQTNHGSHMMSIIGGFKSGTYIGVAPSAEFYMAKTENADSTYEFGVEEDSYVAGLEWLEEKGVEVVNSSLGYSNWYSMQHMDGKTAPVSIAVALAAQRGMLIVTAAGNRGDTIGGYPYLVAPGDAEGVITVGGIDTLFGRWKGAGHGPTADGRRKPELVCLSKNVTIAYRDTADEYRYSSGTSGATAMVSGICALLLQGHPNWTADSVKSALYKTASFASIPNDTMGYGWPDALKAFEVSPPLVDTTSGKFLLPPFPNPFQPGPAGGLVYIPFKINEPSNVNVRIYTMSGRLVFDESRSHLLPGIYSARDQTEASAAFVWDGKDFNDRDLASGIYFVLFLARPGKDVKKIAIIR